MCCSRAAVAAVVVTVIVLVTTLLGPASVIGLALQLTPAGKPLQVMLIAVVNPVDATMPRVVVPDMPGLATVTFAKPETPVNPGWIVKLTGVVLLLLMKLASPP